jgi:hypothetical protein
MTNDTSQSNNQQPPGFEQSERAPFQRIEVFDEQKVEEARQLVSRALQSDYPSNLVEIVPSDVMQTPEYPVQPVADIRKATKARRTIRKIFEDRDLEKSSKSAA